MLAERRRAAFRAAYELLETRYGQKHAVAAGPGTPRVAERGAGKAAARLLATDVPARAARARGRREERSRPLAAPPP